MIRFPRLNLQAKLLAAFALALMPVLALLLINFQVDLNRRQRTMLDSQLQTAQAIANQAAESFDDTINFGWSVADNPLVQTMDPSILDPYLQDLDQRVQTYGNVSVYDARGLNRGWGDPNQPANPRLSVNQMPYYRPYFEKTLTTNSPTVSEVFLLRRPLAVGFAVSVPVRDQSGRPIGVVVIMRRADQLAARFGRVRLQPGQAIFLVDPKGRLAFDTSQPNLPYDESSDFANFPAVSLALRGTPNEQSQFTSPLLGDTRLGAFVPTPAYPWAVGVTIPTSVAFAPAQEAFNDQLAGFGLILVLSMLIAAALAHLLTRPVLRLEKAARELGEGNLSARVQIKTGDELEQLSTTFDRMAAQLEQRQAEVLGLLDRERAFAQIAQALVRELTLSHVIDVVIEQSSRLLNVNAVAVYLADPPRRELTLLAQRGFSPSTVEKMRHLSYDAPSLSATAACTGQVQFVEEIGTSNLPAAIKECYRREGLQTILAIPLQARGRLVGVVAFATRAPRHFSTRDLAFDTAVADLFAVAIENAQLYEEVQQELHGREEFMAAAAHELRTPITVIKGRAQFTLRTDAREEPARKTLQTILEQSNRIENLTEGLLAVLRLRAGTSILNCTRFDLSELVCQEVARIVANTKSFTFQTQADGPLVVEADHQLIGQAIDYLLTNACQYSQPGGTIEVSARHKDGEAVVTVTDHGVGIPLERQPFVFEPFFEALPPGAPGYVGVVSLGLYLSKKIVEVHGGQIWLRSSPGKGTTISFSLPLARNQGSGIRDPDNGGIGRAVF